MYFNQINYCLKEYDKLNNILRWLSKRNKHNLWTAFSNIEYNSGE